MPSSVQGVAAAFLASGGQSGLVPLQVSAASHSPAAGRHGVPAAAFVWLHPVARQLSSVQGFPSSQSSGTHGTVVLDVDEVVVVDVLVVLLAVVVVVSILVVVVVVGGSVRAGTQTLLGLPTRTT